MHGLMLRGLRLSAVRSESKPVERICHTIQVRVVKIRVGVRVTMTDAWPIVTCKSFMSAPADRDKEA